MNGINRLVAAVVFLAIFIVVYFLVDAFIYGKASEEQTSVTQANATVIAKDNSP